MIAGPLQRVTQISRSYPLHGRVSHPTLPAGRPLTVLLLPSSPLGRRASCTLDPGRHGGLWGGGGSRRKRGNLGLSTFPG